MLVDEKFKNIKGNLELELVQLYIAQSDIDNATVRLESIVSDYPRTKTSAEAYYLMGQIYLSESWDLDLAKEKFNQVKKEYSRSEYGPFCNSKIIAINKYKDALAALKQYEAKPDSLVIDSLVIDSTEVVKEIHSLPSYEELLYLIGDIESFSFNRIDSGIVFFEKILEKDPNSPFFPKALFTLSMIYESIDDSVSVDKYKALLKTNFPGSDYTSYLFQSNNKRTVSRPVEQLYAKAEKMWVTNPLSSMETFKKVIQADPLSELSASAAYFLGYQYDYKYADLDSASKYYNWINVQHPNSDQSNNAKYRYRVIENMILSSKKDTITTVN